MRRGPGERRPKPLSLSRKAPRLGRCDQNVTLMRRIVAQTVTAIAIAPLFSIAGKIGPDPLIKCGALNPCFGATDEFAKPVPGHHGARGRAGRWRANDGASA